MLTAQQIEERRSAIGASEASIILGMNPFVSSSFSLWLSKTRGIDPDFTEEQQNRMDLGSLLEDGIAAACARRWNVKLRRTPRKVHKTYPWIAASPDRRVVGTDELVEIKLVGYRQLSAWGADVDSIPLYYFAQVQQQMGCCDKPRARVSALCGTELRFYIVERDDEFIRDMFEAETEWWQRYVIGNTPPPTDGSDDCAKALQRLYPAERDADLVDASGTEVDALLMRLLQVKAAQKELDGERGVMENDLKARIAEGIGFVVRSDGETIARATWKKTAGGGIDRGRLIEDLIVSGRLTDEEVAKYQLPGARRLDVRAVTPKEKR